MFIYHVAVNIRIRVKSTTIGRVTQTISLLLFVLTGVSTFLTNLFNFLDLILLLKVFRFNVLNAVLILLL